MGHRWPTMVSARLSNGVPLRSRLWLTIKCSASFLTWLGCSLWWPTCATALVWPFTGPFSKLQSCPVCSSERYETVMQGNKLIFMPHKQALTIPVVPQIQAQYWSQEGAWNTGHQSWVMEPMLTRLCAGGSIKSYNNMYSSSILIDVAMCGDLTPSDTNLMLSIDSAQLYESKQSDCWIYMGSAQPRSWTAVQEELCLTQWHYPRSKQAKEPQLFHIYWFHQHHLSALQKDGLQIWDCRNGHVFTLQPYFFLGTADGPGLAALHGQVSHHGMYGCWEYCGLKGCNKPGGPHYYPALLKPLSYDNNSCNHDDVDVYKLPTASPVMYFGNLHQLLLCTNDAQFREMHKLTGLCKASIFVGLSWQCLSGLPGCLSICWTYSWVCGVGQSIAIRRTPRGSGTG